MTSTLTPDLDRCERGLHPATQLDEHTGQPTCADCGSLVTVPMSPMCQCGRGHVTVLMGFEACCALCAHEAIPERPPIDSALVGVVGRFAGRHRRGGQGGV